MDHCASAIPTSIWRQAEGAVATVCQRIQLWRNNLLGMHCEEVENKVSTQVDCTCWSVSYTPSWTSACSSGKSQMKKCLPWLTFLAHCTAFSIKGTKITPVDAPEECASKLKRPVINVECAASSVSSRSKSLCHPERYTIGVSSVLLSSLVISIRADNASMLSCVAKGLITDEGHLPLLLSRMQSANLWHTIALFHPTRPFSSRHTNGHVTPDDSAFKRANSICKV